MKELQGQRQKGVPKTGRPPRLEQSNPPLLLEYEYDGGPKYHDTAEVKKGIRRSVCHVGMQGCYVALRIRTTDRTPDESLLRRLKAEAGPGICLKKAGEYYEVYMEGVQTSQLSEAMRKVDEVGKKLLQTKEIAQGLAGDDTKALITELSRA